MQPSSAAVPSTQSRRAGQPASPILGSSARREGGGWGLRWHRRHPQHGYEIPGMATGSLAWLWDSWWSYSIYGTARIPAMDKSICATARSPQQPWQRRHGHGIPRMVNSILGMAASPKHPRHPWHCQIPGTALAPPSRTTAPPARPRHPRLPPLTLDADVDAAQRRAVLVGGPAGVAPGIAPADGPAAPGAGGALVAGAAGAGGRVPLGAARQLAPLALHPGAVCGAPALRQAGLIWGGTRVWSENHRTIELQSYRTIELWNYRFTELENLRITEF